MMRRSELRLSVPSNVRRNTQIEVTRDYPTYLCTGFKYTMPLTGSKDNQVERRPSHVSVTRVSTRRNRYDSDICF